MHDAQSLVVASTPAVPLVSAQLPPGHGSCSGPEELYGHLRCVVQLVVSEGVDGAEEYAAMMDVMYFMIEDPSGEVDAPVLEPPPPQPPVERSISRKPKTKKPSAGAERTEAKKLNWGDADPDRWIYPETACGGSYFSS